MRFRHIVIWICLSGWVWAYPSTNQISTAEEFIKTLGYDSESDFPEEDLDHIQRLLSEPLSDASALTLMKQISIISMSDLEIIEREKKISTLKNKSGLSPALRSLINNIHIIHKQKSKSSIQERISFTKGTRHDWRGSMTLDGYEIGMLLEKDPEEINIADHAVFYIKGSSGSFHWIAGDHQLVGGYGLVSWRTVSAYKGFETINILPRSGKGLSPYRSSNEFWSTNGIGAELETQVGKIIVSFGRNILDGKLTNNNINIDKTGLHITQGDLEIKNQLIEKSASFMWQQNINQINVGSIINNQYVKNKLGDFVQRTSASIFSSGKMKDWLWFGEGAFSNNMTSAILGGIRYHAHKIKYLISYRSYMNGFQSYRSQPFGEWHGQAIGEKGLFQNVEIKLNRHIITVYSDVAEKIDKNNQKPNNKLSHETGIRWRWQNSIHQFRIQWKQDAKTNDDAEFFTKNVSNNNIRITTKWKYQYKMSKNLSAQWKIHTAKYIDYKHSGRGLETRIIWDRNNSALTFSWIVADVKSYNERLYFWDVNLPGEMKNVVVSGKEHQFGVRMQYKGKDNYRMFLRWRAAWNEWNLGGTPTITGALAIEINL